MFFSYAIVLLFSCLKPLSKASGRIGRLMLEFIFSADLSGKQCFFIHVGSFLSLQAKHNMSARIGTIGRSGSFPRNKTKK